MSIANKDAFVFDPDFAVICSFLEKFSNELQVNYPDFKQLEDWLSNTQEVPSGLQDLHIQLMRRIRKTVHESHWEIALRRFIFTYSSPQVGWELESRGYKKLSTKVKLRILRELLESQFDYNKTFRTKLMTMSADSLRSKPIGRDKLGHNYWCTQDMESNLRIYQEHLDEGIWKAVATNRNELLKLKSHLRYDKMVLPSEINVDDRQKMEEFALQNIELECSTGKGRWSFDSEELDLDEEKQYESDPGSPLFRSDDEFSPELELEDSSQLVLRKRARTAQNMVVEVVAKDESCQQCGKADRPEWILLCDKCDKGYHCACLSPVIFEIPDESWFCPSCQQQELIDALETRVNKFDDRKLTKEKVTIDKKRRSVKL